MKSDVYIAGIVARNRALNADIVVLQMLPKDEWKVMFYCRLVNASVDTIFSSFLMNKCFFL